MNTRYPAIPALLSNPPSKTAGIRWRTIAVSGSTLGFSVRRSKRNTIGLSVNEAGLLVTAPGWVTLSQIDEVVQEKLAWILDKAWAHQDKAERTQKAESQWCPEGVIPFMGQALHLQIPGDGAQVSVSADNEVPHNLRLHLPLEATAHPERICTMACVWLQAQARQHYAQRIAHFSQLYGLSPSSWRLSSASTRWGSCSSTGRIALNWRLIHFTPFIIDYVIVHELAHLKEMNHSSRFWQLVQKMLPDYKTAREALRHHSPRTLPLLESITGVS